MREKAWYRLTVFLVSLVLMAGVLPAATLGVRADGIRYNSLDDLNGQASAWCNKVNAKAHGTTNEIPFERLKKEGL